MNRKIRVIILTMVLTVLMFGGTRLMAQDNLDVNTTEASQTETPNNEGNLEPEGEEVTSSVEPGKNTEIDGNEANDEKETGETETTKPEAKEDENTEVNKTETTEGKPKAKQEEKTEAKTSAETPADKKADNPAGAPAKAPEKPEEPGKEDGSTGDGAGKTPDTGTTPTEGKGTGEGEGTEPKKPTPEVDPDEDKDLSELKAEIDKEQDPDKKAELQKQYNEKYLEKVEAEGKDKLDPSVQDRLTDAKDIKAYNDIMDKQKEIQKKKDDIDAKIAAGNLSPEEIDALYEDYNKSINEYNELIGRFKPPRVLSPEEKKVREELDKEYEIPGVKEDKNDLFKNYKEARQALKDALDPENEGVTPEKLKELQEAYKAAKEALYEAIGKTIEPKYTTDDKPEVRVYPLDGSTAGKELKDKDETYYIPDNTNLNLLIEVRKDGNKEFTFTIKPNKTDETDENIPDADLLDQMVRFKNGDPVKLTKNEDGTYSFTTSDEFQIAQLKLNLPAFRAAFHKGFEIEMKAGDQDPVTKKFLITKKGYDDADIGTIGTEKPKDPQEIDGGDTTDGIVDEDTKKVYDIFAMIKETDGYIDDVIVNSANGESLPLSSVDITSTLPKYSEKFADYLYKSGLKYDLIDAKKGQYRLKLDTKVFGGNLIEEDGQLYRKGENGEKTGEALTPADLKGFILEEAGKKVYVDSDGKTHEVTTEEYYEVTDEEGNTFKVQDGKLYKKNAGGTDELVGEFKDGKLKKEGTTYVFNNGKLISYTDEKDLFEGNVSNKNGEADLDVTPTYEGDQVIIKNGDNKQAYGGTIIENGIFKDGKYIGKTSSADGYQGYEKAYVDANGKIFKDNEGNVIVNPTEEQKASLKEVPNGVFNKDGFIVSGLTFKKDYTLIDKFGKIIEGVTVKKNETENNYTFTKGTETKTQDTTTIIVNENSKNFVGNDNYIITNETGYERIVGKYYYDKGKFEKVEDTDKGIKGNKYYKDYKSSEMTFKKVDSYTKDGKKEILNNKTVYHGSTNPEDYVSVNGKTYVKKQAGSLVYYVGVDGDNQAEVLSVEQISRIVQILKDENGYDYEKITDETDIAEAVKNAKFQIKFPGFLAGKDIVYNIHADIAATYMAPNSDKEFVKQSIFKDQDAEYKKAIDKYFTLKIKEGSPASFFKNPPKELLAKPDYNFFNVFYRDETDRDRDGYIKHLLEIKDNDEDRVKPENKEKMDILNKIQYELGRLYDGAKFALVEKNGKKELVIRDKNNKEITLDRSLLWEVGFNNPDGALFPENKDSEIIIEDHNMDNRLIYDEIIVNDTQDKWNELNKEYEEAKKKVAAAEKALADNKDENAKAKLEAALEEAKKELEEKKFKGNDQYFFIDQIKDIRFGVNPNYIDGRFVPLGAEFKITSEEILAALEATTTGKISYDKADNTKKVSVFVENGRKFIEKGGIRFEVRRDDANGQIRIKVMNAFYKKVENDPTHKFESPVQEDYQKKINNLWTEVKKLNKDSTPQDIEGIVQSLHAKDTDCYDTIAKMLKDEFENIKGNPDELKKFQRKLIAEVEKLQLAYLDSKKNDGDYKYDDMRFNAIRIGLKSGLRIGGPTDPVKTKKLGITSVIIPEVDIPYTDEFGDALSNKDKYVQEEIGKIKKAKKLSDEQFKKQMRDEDFFREVMAEAYGRVNEKITSKEIEIKPLVTVDDNAKYGRGKFKVIAGNSKDLSFEDLANGDKALKDSKGQPLNPYYVGDKKEDGTVTTIADKIKDEFKNEFKDAYEDFISRPIDIAGYYMSKLGYNGAMYANFANYKLVGGEDQAPGIFGKEDDWHKKICYPGLGSCIETAGGDSESGKTDGGNKYGSEGEAGSEFELTYTPTPKTPDEEHPKVDKKSETDKVNVSEEDEKDKTVDFTIDVTVDKLKKDQKELSEALKTDSEEVKDDNYDKKTGYYIYRDGLIIDILPDIFEFTNETKISVKVNKDAMRANGANATLDFDKFQNGIKYLYKEDVKAYLAELKAKGDKKYNVLLKALGGDESKIKDGQRAVIAWLPEFEGPHGAKNQFTMTLTNLLVNKEKYKESEENKNKGQAYINEGGFGDKGEFFFGTKTITVTDGHNANVNKYLQLLDKDGKVIPQGEAGEWFKGSATLKFGDKFNYKIKYYLDNKGLVDTGFVQKDREWKLEDLFNGNEGLLPVLRDFVKAPEGFTVLYLVNGEYKKASDMTKDQLAKVEGIKINPPEAGFPYNEEREFILPMMIPEIDAEIDDNGTVIYLAKDGTKKILGPADKFFNLGDLTNKDAKMYFENKADKSNTVTVYLDKERFIKLYKEFFDANGNEIKKDRPEVKFDIIQIIKDEDGNVVEKKKLDKELTLNEKNEFVDQVYHLPLFKRIEEMDEKGNVTVKTLSYTYEVKEQAIAGYTGKVFTIDDDYDLGFVLKAKNYEKPEEPEEPEEDEPKEPEEPEEDEPKEPKEEEPHEPEEEHDHEEHEEEKPHDDENDRDRDQGKNKLPKTGVAEDLASIYFAFVLLLGLVFIKKRYLVK